MSVIEEAAFIFIGAAVATLVVVGTAALVAWLANRADIARVRTALRRPSTDTEEQP